MAAFRRPPGFHAEGSRPQSSTSSRPPVSLSACHTTPSSAHEPAIVDAEDRAYVESLSPGPERDAVVASLLRYRNPEALEVGDPLPAVTVRGAEALAQIELATLVRDRPLLLVFGSYT